MVIWSFSKFLVYLFCFFFALILVSHAVWKDRWVTEVVPMELSSFLPLILCPLLGLVKGSEIAKFYFNDTSFLMCAGFLIGLAVERWGMHKRIAYAVCAKFGYRVNT